MSATVDVPKVAYTYLRISRDRDNDELGVSRQRVALQEMIEQRGWVHGRKFVDNDLTAYRAKRRPGYEALLESIRSGDCDVVCSSEMERLTRHPRELEDLVDALESNHVQVMALRAGHIDLSTSGGRITARILGAVARGESERMAERIKARMAQNSRAGKPSGGPRPYGYDRVNGKLVLNRDEAKRIKRWVADILAGPRRLVDRHGDERQAGTVSSIVTQLNDEQVPTVRGGRWTGPTINQILRSPRLIGMTASKGEPVAKAEWPAILQRDEWEAVCGILEGRRRGPTPRKSLLAGLVYCGHCGKPMFGLNRGKRARQYGCPTTPKSRGGCGRVFVAAAALDQYIVDRVVVTAEHVDLSLVRSERHEHDSRRLVGEIVEDEQALNEMAAAVGEGKFTRAEWFAWRVPTEKRLQANRAALKALGHGDQLPPDVATLDPAKWRQLTFDQQRAVLRLFIDRIVVDPIGNKAGSKFRPQRVQVSWEA